MLSGAGAQVQRGATVSVYFACGEKEAKPLGVPEKTASVIVTRMGRNRPLAGSVELSEERV